MPNTKTRRAVPDRRSRRGRRMQESRQQTHLLKMRHNLRERIQACQELALECASKAEMAASEESRDNYLRIEKSWINLARSYEFAAQLLDERGGASLGGFYIDGESLSTRLH